MIHDTDHPSGTDAQTPRTRESFVATHEGYFLGFLPILWNEDDSTIMGKTPFWDALILPLSYAWNCLSVVAAYLFPGFENQGWPMRLREVKKKEQESRCHENIH
jgi:hypothetical protein